MSPVLAIEGGWGVMTTKSPTHTYSIQGGKNHSCWEVNLFGYTCKHVDLLVLELGTNSKWHVDSLVLELGTNSESDMLIFRQSWPVSWEAAAGQNWWGTNQQPRTSILYEQLQQAPKHLLLKSSYILLLSTSFVIYKYVSSLIFKMILSN